MKGFSLVALSGGHSLVAMLGLLIAVASLVAEHGLSGARTSAVAAHGLNEFRFLALEHRLNSCGN